MKIRLHGLPEEVEQTKEVFQRLFDVVAISENYPDRGTSKLVRCYVEISLKEINQNLLEVVKEDEEYIKALVLLSSSTKCENCPLSVNCLNIKEGTQKSLSGCMSMWMVVASKIYHLIDPLTKLDDKTCICSVIDKFCTKEGIKAVRYEC